MSGGGGGREGGGVREGERRETAKKSSRVAQCQLIKVGWWGDT